MSLVSVIIPTYNRASLVIRAIHSVLNQTYQNFELIIIDDGSTDETERLLSSFVDAGLLTYFKNENRGVSAARNFGVEKSTGDWIAFLDSDDEWLKDKLYEQIQFIKNNVLSSIVYGEEIWMRKERRVNPRIIHQKHGGWIFDRCIQQCFIAPSSVMMKKTVFQEMGGFDQDFTVCEDYDLWLKISSLYEIGHIAKPLIIKYGGHEDQLSTKYVAMDIWRLRSLKRILTIRKLSDEDKEKVIQTIKKKGEILLLGYQKHGNVNGALEVSLILNGLV